MIKSGKMVLKGVNRECYDTMRSMKIIGYTMIKLGQMVLKGVNRVHTDKIRSNGLERSQLGTQ